MPEGILCCIKKECYSRPKGRLIQPQNPPRFPIQVRINGCRRGIDYFELLSGEFCLELSSRISRKDHKSGEAVGF